MPEMALQAYAGPEIMSREFLNRAERVPASEDPDQATAQTVQLMCEQIARSAADPLVKACARAAVAQWRGGPVFASTGRDAATDPQAIAESIWWWAKHQLKFVHHSKLIEVWLNERDQLQLLIEPAVLVRMKRMQGDCAIYTMLIAALLDCFNVPWEIVTLAVDPEQPSIFSHVFPRVVLASGRRVPLDASHGRYPGWQVPRNRTFREQVWDENGEPIMSKGTFQGLHGYERSRWSWGMGDDSTDGSTIDASSYSINLQPPVDTSGIDTGNSYGTTSLVADASNDSLAVCPAGFFMSGGVCTSGSASAYSSGSMVAPSQSSTAWAGFAASMAKAGLTLAEIQSMAPGTIVNPNGQIIRQATGYPISTTGIATSLSTLGSSSMLWLGLGAIVLLMFMQKGR